jgi:hypothetical protein
VWSGIGAAVILMGIGGAIGGSGTSTTKAAAIVTPPPATVTASTPVPGETATVTTTATVVHTAPAVTVTAPPPPPATAFAGNGVYLVGKDVQPGTYRSAGPDGSNPVGCYVELDDAAGTIISNDSSHGQMIVTVPSSAHVLKATSCKDFSKA